MNFQGQHGRTPLHKAAEKAFPVLIKALCEARADPDSRDHFGILLANWTFCHDPLWKPFLPDLAEMVENMFKTCDRWLATLVKVRHPCMSWPSLATTKPSPSLGDVKRFRCPARQAGMSPAAGGLSIGGRGGGCR